MHTPVVQVCAMRQMTQHMGLPASWAHIEVRRGTDWCLRPAAVCHFLPCVHIQRRVPMQGWMHLSRVYAHPIAQPRTPSLPANTIRMH